MYMYIHMFQIYICKMNIDNTSFHVYFKDIAVAIYMYVTFIYIFIWTFISSQF